MRRNFCQACSFADRGVITRIPLDCTCGENRPVKRRNEVYEPTREELDKYLERLKELMESSSNDPDSGEAEPGK
jgi:hypothetical protein